MGITVVMAGSATALAGWNDPQFIASKATYDAIVKTPDNYNYLAPATPSYNCLAWALQNQSSWVWPWVSNPTSAEVDNYLYGKGYVGATFPSEAQIISYGTSSTNITHFGRVADSNYVNAKWGQLERLQSLSWDPYSYSGGYGPKIKTYAVGH